MKKLYFIVTFFFVVFFSVSAQQNKLKVTPSGIVMGPANLQSGVNINLSNSGSNLTGMYLLNSPSSTGSWAIASGMSQILGYDKDVAIRVYAQSATPLSKARSFGIYAVAGNATSGWNDFVATVLWI